MYTDRIMNVIKTAAVADSFAMPLMSRPPYLIRSDYGEGRLVEDLMAPLPDSPGYPFNKGMVTDVFSSSYYLLKAILNYQEISTPVVEEALFEWRDSNDSKQYYDHFAGKSTKLRMSILDGTHQYDRFDKVPCEGRFITSGGASRAWIAGIFNPGNVEKAIKDSLIIIKPTHPNAIAASGAAALAAMISAGLSGESSIDKLYELARKAVKAGYSMMESSTGMTAVGSKVYGRLEYAAGLAIKYGGDEEKLIEEVHDRIGVGEYVSESVPAAMAFIIASDGDPVKALRLSANAGNAANKVAVMTCSVVAAATGKDELVERFYKEVKDNNPFDVEGLRDNLEEYFKEI